MTYRKFQVLSFCVAASLSTLFDLWGAVPRWVYVLSILLGFLAMATDRWTTVRCLQLQERFKRLGIVGGMKEQNKLVGNVQTVRAFVLSPGAFAIDLLCLFFCVRSGGAFGFAVFLIKGYASLNNRQTERAMRRMIARRRHQLVRVEK